MKRFFELERIGDDAFTAAKFAGGHYNLKMSRWGMAIPHLEPFVCRPNSSGEYSIRLPYRRDYSRANGVGSRGVFAVYELESPGFYKVHERVSWGRCDDYFICVDERGIHRCEEEEAMEWARKG